MTEPDRLAVWTASGGAMVALRRPLRDAPPYVRCAVVYYGGLDLQHRRAVVPPTVCDAELRDFSPIWHLKHSAAPVPPLFIARAGRDSPRRPGQPAPQRLHRSLRGHSPHPRCPPHADEPPGGTPRLRHAGRCPPLAGDRPCHAGVPDYPPPRRGRRHRRRPSVHLRAERLRSFGTAWRPRLVSSASG